MRRAEVRPRMRGLRPRPVLRCSVSFESLILAKVRDREPQRIDGYQIIRNARLEDEHEVRGIKIALQLAVFSRRVVDQIKIDTSAVGGILQLFERDFLYVHIDLGRGSVHQEFPNDVVLAIGIEDAIRELSVEEVERLREIILDGVAIAPVIE